jgi:chemotaxis protein MotB
MAGKGGGAWKVAYADFVTAMMAFFLVMWILAQSKEVKQAVAHYFNEPYQSSSQGADLRAGPPKDPPPPASPPTPKALHLALPTIPPVVPARDSEPPAKGSLEARKTPKAESLALHDGNKKIRGTVIRFAGDSADLSGAAKEELSRLVPDLRGKRNKVELRGHAARGPVSAFQDAWILCYARSLATMKYLEQEGIEPERIRLSQAGVHEPFTISDQPLVLNARVEVYMLDEFVEDLTGTRKERAKRISKP